MIFPAIPGLIASMSNGPVTVHRAGAPVKSARGEWERGPRVPLVISPAVVHVSGSRTVTRDTGALRESETLRMTCLEPIYDASLGVTPDWIEWEGAMYEVSSVADHESLAGCRTVLATRREVVP